MQVLHIQSQNLEKNKQFLIFSNFPKIHIFLYSASQTYSYKSIYKITKTNPLFNPGPIEHPFIPIHLAAVNPYMSMVAGEVAEGVRPHPVCTPRYIQEVMWPEIRRGLDKSCRGDSHFCVAIKPLIATGADRVELDKNKEDVRARIAFYGATWAYRKTFDFNGLGKIAANLRFLSKENF